MNEQFEWNNLTLCNDWVDIVIYKVQTQSWLHDRVVIIFLTETYNEGKEKLFLFFFLKKKNNIIDAPNLSFS